MAAPLYVLRASGLASASPVAAQDRSCPVIRRSASRYLSAVRAITSAGRSGGGGVLFQGCCSSQSRTNCLSKLGGDWPTRYESAGQKRDESGVSTSSIRRSRPS